MTAAPQHVSAVIPTRGDVDLSEVLATLPFDDVVVWDNSVRPDLKVYGRYAALAEVRHPIVYVQDDDCTLTPEAIEQLLAMYKPGEITCNMPISRWPDYPDSCLVGWGAVFDAYMPQVAFDRYRRYHPNPDEQFLRECDVVFTTLAPHTKLDLGFTHLPWAELPDRMFKQPRPSRAVILDQARRIRDERREEVA